MFLPIGLYYNCRCEIENSIQYKMFFMREDLNSDMSEWTCCGIMELFQSNSSSRMSYYINKNPFTFPLCVPCCGRRRRDLISEDESSKIVSTTSSANELNDSGGKRMKLSGLKTENGGSKAEAEASSAGGNKQAEQSSKPSEPPKDYIHVRARRGQATDSHSLAERARREKISERMKILQDLVPGCNKVIGKALVLDEIINYIQSLQRQVEFLSMKLEAVNSRMSLSPTFEGFHSKDLGAQPFDATEMLFGSQAAREYAQGSQSEWLHMQVGGSFERAT